MALFCSTRSGGEAKEMFVAIKNLVGAISDKWESFSNVTRGASTFGHFFLSFQSLFTFTSTSTQEMSGDLGEGGYLRFSSSP